MTKKYSQNSHLCVIIYLSIKLYTFLSKQKTLKLCEYAFQMLFLLYFYIRTYAKQSQCNYVILLTDLFTHFDTGGETYAYRTNISGCQKQNMDR